MPAREIKRITAASPTASQIPDLPHIGPQLLNVPGMMEYGRELQTWWDRFRRTAVGARVDDGKTLRKIEAVSTAGLTTLTARVEAEEIARASGDSALASRTSALEASVDTPVTGLLARVTTIESAYVDASGAYAQAVAAISAELTGPSGDIYAAILTESNARAAADSALATRTDALEVSIDTPTTGLLARVSTIESTYVDASGAYAEAISAITAELAGPSGDIYAAIEVESNARATADEAFAATVAQLTATLGDQAGSILTEETVRATADSALASRASALEASVDTPTTGLLARVTTIESAYVDASGAYAQAVAAITAELSGPSGDIYAAIEVESNARATVDEALASTIAQLTAVVGDQSASIITEETVRASQVNGLYARWGVAIDINGHVAGRINLDGTNESSSFTVAVDKFVVTNANGTITAFDIRTGGKIVFGADVQSDNFVANTSGWRLERSSGDVEFGSGTFRGIVRGGATAFGTGTGFWMGLDGGQYKFRVGDPAGARVEWDGSSWNVVSWPGGVSPYTLTLTNSTGNPTNNPTGAGSYTIGTRVNIVAVNPAEPGSLAFQYWTSTSQAAINALDDPMSPNTWVTVIGDISLEAFY